MRVIAESTRKSDQLDARILAEFLALDMIPAAYRPSKRQRAHRILVCQRCYVSRRLTSVRNKVRRIVSNYNADREDLFTEAGLVYLSKTAVLEADRFVLDQLLVEWRTYTRQLVEANRRLEAFAQQAPAKETEARAIPDTIDGIWVSAGLPVGMRKHGQTSLPVPPDDHSAACGALTPERMRLRWATGP